MPEHEPEKMTTHQSRQLITEGRRLQIASQEHLLQLLLNDGAEGGREGGGVVA
jgi:hypothetical protein